MRQSTSKITIHRYINIVIRILEDWKSLFSFWLRFHLKQNLKIVSKESNAFSSDFQDEILRFDVRFGEEKEKRNEIKISNIFNI